MSAGHPGERARQAPPVSNQRCGSGKREVLQAVIIVVCILVGAALGWLLNGDHLAGALVGAPSGMMLGIVGGGFLLSSYRSKRPRDG